MSRSLGLPFQSISGVTGEGLSALLESMWRVIGGDTHAGSAGRARARRRGCCRRGRRPADGGAHATRPMRRLGILGGTFDPVHFGHLDAAAAAQAAMALDTVLLVPSHDPPHTPLDPHASAFHRFAMVSWRCRTGRPSLRATSSCCGRGRPTPSTRCRRCTAGAGRLRSCSS